MSDVSVLVTDGANTLKAIFAKIRGKHGSDPDTAKLADDAEKILAELPKAIEVAKKDGPALVRDVEGLAAALAPAVAEALAQNPAALAALTAALAPLEKLVADAQQTLADLKAAKLA